VAISSDDILKRVPPQDLVAEQSVLGAILLDNASIAEALGLLSASDFYRESHRQIFSAMVWLSEASEPIDAITLTDRLRTVGVLEQIGGPAYLAELASVTPTAALVPRHAHIVRSKAILRHVGSVATDIASSSYEGVADVEEFLDNAERQLLQITGPTTGVSLIGMPESTREALKTIEQLYERGNPVTGVATGFRDLDRLTAGLHGGNLIVIAARPSMGKTSLACDIAMRAAFGGGEAKQDPVGVAFFSIEMTREELTVRMLCSEAGIDAHKMRAGFLGERDFPRLASAAANLSESDLFIDDNSSITPVQLKAACRRHSNRLKQAGKKLGLVCVDYIQLMNSGMSGGQYNREAEVAHISKSLKALAKELHIPVVAMSQLNRQVESRAERRPVLADLRESGAIEQDADLIAFIYRDEVYHPDTKDPGIAEIIVAKQRNGPTDTIRLAYLKHLTRFEDLDERFMLGNGTR
jgi:replicative DNA helicase